MIRRLINLVTGRPASVAPKPITSIGIPREMRVTGTSSGTLGSPRRGITLSPMVMVKADRRAASKRARIARRASR